jgi:dTDP-4-dehydrorhamnose reductase
MRIVVTGANGQLGPEVVRQANEAGHQVIVSVRADLDLSKVRRLLDLPQKDWLGVDAIINCAAYTDVDGAETNREEAMRVNALAPGLLARQCRELDCKLLQVSTDHVFGQDRGRDRPYEEDDAPGPVNVYGESKLAGEGAVRAEWSKHFIVRTCGLYGFTGLPPAAAALIGILRPKTWSIRPAQRKNFVKTMLRLADEGKPIRVVKDQVCTPTNVRDVAALLLRLVETDAYGTYHATNSGQCSWHEFAAETFRLACKQVDLTAILTAELQQSAKRPAYSVLANTQLKRLGMPIVRPWQKALAEYLDGL